MYRDSDESVDMFVELLVGVMVKAGFMGLALWGADADISPPWWIGVADWKVDSRKDRCHFSFSVEEDGESVGDETDVEDEEDARLKVSSAPEDVTS